jgi:hypothetical protein
MAPRRHPSDCHRGPSSQSHYRVKVKTWPESLSVQNWTPRRFISCPEGRLTKSNRPEYPSVVPRQSAVGCFGSFSLPSPLAHQADMRPQVIELRS